MRRALVLGLVAVLAGCPAPLVLDPPDAGGGGAAGGGGRGSGGGGGAAPEPDAGPSPPTPCKAGPGALEALVVDGVCQITRCIPGLTTCTGYAPEGCDVDIETDLDNCGGCGVRCSSATLPHVTYVGCAGAACAKILACDTGFADCDGDPANGCEVDLQAGADNCARCGACANPCQAPAYPSCLGVAPHLHCGCTT